MHAKTDSEATSIESSWPHPRPLYYVQSPSNHDVEKMSYGSSPAASPTHRNYYPFSPSHIHHSRESSTSRFSASVKYPRNLSAWKHVQIDDDNEDGDDDDIDQMDGNGGGGHRANNVRPYLCFVLLFFALFATFSLILWGVSRRFDPKIFVKNIVFENFYYQAGNDPSGIPTDMLSLNSTVKIVYRNPSTFFAVHVTSSPWELQYFQLKIASGQMSKFTQSRKSERTVETVVRGKQVPLYGGIQALLNTKEHLDRVALPLNLTFVIRSRAYILGKLVKTKFYGNFRCSVALRGNELRKPLNLTDSCMHL